MPGVEQPSSKHWLHDDNTRIILATLATIAVAAGSTLWRRSLAAQSANCSTEPISEYHKKEDMSAEADAVDAGGLSASSKSSKNSRSKERRKRGKDPVKLMSTATTSGTSTNLKREKGKKQNTPKSASIVVPQIIEPPRASLDESRSSQSTASPSTSRSSSISDARNPGLLDVFDPAAGPDEDDDEQTPLITALAASQSAPAIHDVPELDQPLRASQSDNTFASGPPTPNTLSSASSSIMISTPASETAYKPLPQTLQPSVSMYPHYTSPSPSHSPNRRMSPAPNGSWDYDNHAPPDPATIYRKPPRFRSKSRGSSGSNIGTGLEIPMALQTSVSYNPTVYGGLPLLVPSDSASSSEGGGDLEPAEIMPVFTFPTLNNPCPSPGPSVVPISPSRPISRPASAASSRSRMGSNANGMHHAQTPSITSLASSPLRTPTPSQPQPHPQSPLVSSFASSSASTPVSAQTQLASLRGALEAARLREEKARQDVDRLSRECADLRWRWGEDAGRWSKREIELQNYIHMLTQHLQGYASILASVPQGQNALQTPFPVPYPTANPNSVPNAIPNGVYTGSSSQSHSPSPAAHSQLHSQPPAQPQSPASHSHPASPQVNSSVLSPFSPYTQLPPQPHFQPPTVQRSQQLQYQNHPPHPHHGYGNPNNIFSLFFPGAGGSGTTSGYNSPNASPILGGMGMGMEGDGSPLGDRGQRRGRMRTRTATQRDRDAEGGASGDVFDGGEEEEEEEEFNDVLADAILKRPESIRNGSFRSLKRKTSAKETRKEQVNLNDDGVARATISAGTPDDGDGWIRYPDVTPTPPIPVEGSSS